LKNVREQDFDIGFFRSMVSMAKVRRIQWELEVEGFSDNVEFTESLLRGIIFQLMIMVVVDQWLSFSYRRAMGTL